MLKGPRRSLDTLTVRIRVSVGVRVGVRVMDAWSCRDRLDAFSSRFKHTKPVSSI